MNRIFFVHVSISDVFDGLKPILRLLNDIPNAINVTGINLLKTLENGLIGTVGVASVGAAALTGNPNALSDGANAAGDTLIAIPTPITDDLGSAIKLALGSDALTVSTGSTLNQDSAVGDGSVAAACSTGGACFTAGTLIETSQGLKAIETFTGGELVWSRHEHTFEYGYRPVIATKATSDQLLYKVIVSNPEGKQEIYHTTSEHPFWVEGEGWLKASLLQAGMTLVDRNNHILHVQNLDVLEDTATVFNIEVQDSHTYHIGVLGVWVHNAQCCDFTNKYGPLSSQWFDANGNAYWMNPLDGQYEQIPAGATVSVDHILPQNFINTLPGFDQLPADVQKSLINDPDNLQPMIKSANCSKGCTVEFTGSGWQSWNGDPIDPAYKAYLQAAQDNIQSKIQIAIKNGGVQ